MVTQPVCHYKSRYGCHTLDLSGHTSANRSTGLTSELLESLPNAIVADIVREANNRLYFDPVQCLPHEIVLQIFGDFDCATLLKTSLVSKAWKTIAFQPPLWREQFRSSGWTHNRDNLRSFEDNSRMQVKKIWANPRIRPRPSDLSPDNGRAKRQCSSSNETRSGAGRRLWVARSALAIPDAWMEPPVTQESIDSSGQVQRLRNTNDISQANEQFDQQLGFLHNKEFEHIPEQTVCPLLNPSRLVDTFSEAPRMNWQWLYKQRYRLERNWDKGSFRNFRLPHNNFPEEGHTECVYTLQFSQKYLVSGSRDKSVRVWDLDRQRLKMPPLLGHNGSVLCLQFDDSPKTDLIISGSSDSDVIIWRFSTGKMIKRLYQAHREPVLNLQFDDRYLITCSKDHTIKLWNMSETSPTDSDYPNRNKTRNASYPDHIVSIEDMQNNPNMLHPSEPLLKFTHLMTFSGHGAAVNAIHMCGNFIVSASGDRKIMLWDIKEGTQARVFSGHTKGIACVQFDGRRIVSGSNDKTVRIFDSATGAQVALLNSHSHLVRTVQAEFGDMFESDDIVEAEARDNDRMLIDAEINGVQSTDTTSSRHFVFGAKLPPGGGGNRWSKIVSGSYDQTVMIWRRNRDGTWRIARELRYDEALERCSPATTRSRGATDPSLFETPLQADPRLRPEAQTRAQPIRQPIPLVPLSTPNNGPGNPGLGIQQPSQNSANGAAAHAALHATYLNLVTAQVQAQTNPRAQRIAQEAAEREASRVFKLQFDARRIIVSSSNHVIVGWDFANGDQDIEEASQFFGEPA